MLGLPSAHINAYFILDGEKYEVERFNIKFTQWVDFKGQPQHETKGGQITLSLSRPANDTLYRWAKKSTLLKDGQVLFQTDMGISVLRVSFTNGYCINLTRSINAFAGCKTSLIISSENIDLNGVDHENAWRKN